MKTCFKCGETKPLDDFYKHPAMSGGHLGKCKECTKADVSENYRKRRSAYAEYDKKRYMRPERKQAALRYQRKSRIANREKWQAREAVFRAIRNGELTRGPCAVCGEVKTEGHHADYAKPLDVTWLCRKHHVEIHGKQANS